MARGNDEQKKTLLRMRGRGATFAEAAEAMNVTRSAACALGNRLSQRPGQALHLTVDADVAAFLEQLARRNRTSPEDEAAAMLAEIARDTAASEA